MAESVIFLALISVIISSVCSDSVNVDLSALNNSKCGSENGWLEPIAYRRGNSKALQASSFSCASFPIKLTSEGTLTISVYFDSDSDNSRLQILLQENDLIVLNYIYNKSNKDFEQGWHNVSLNIEQKVNADVTLLGFSEVHDVILINSIQLKTKHSLPETWTQNLEDVEIINLVPKHHITNSGVEEIELNTIKTNNKLDSTIQYFIGHGDNNYYETETTLSVDQNMETQFALNNQPQKIQLMDILSDYDDEGHSLRYESKRSANKLSSDKIIFSPAKSNYYEAQFLDVISKNNENAEMKSHDSNHKIIISKNGEKLSNNGNGQKEENNNEEEDDENANNGRERKNGKNRADKEENANNGGEQGENGNNGNEEGANGNNGGEEGENGNNGGDEGENGNNGGGEGENGNNGGGEGENGNNGGEEGENGNNGGEGENGNNGGGEGENGNNGGEEEENGNNGGGEGENGNNGGEEGENDNNGGEEGENGNNGGEEGENGNNGGEGENGNNGGGEGENGNNGGEEGENSNNGGEEEENGNNGGGEGENGNNGGEEGENDNNGGGENKSFWNIWTIVLVSVASATLLAMVTVGAYCLGKIRGRNVIAPIDVSDLEAPRIIPRVQNIRTSYERFGTSSEYGG